MQVAEETVNSFVYVQSLFNKVVSWLVMPGLL